MLTKFKPSLRRLLEAVILGQFVVKQVLNVSWAGRQGAKRRRELPMQRVAVVWDVPGSLRPGG